MPAQSLLIREVLRLQQEEWGIISGEEREATERAIHRLQ